MPTPVTPPSSPAATHIPAPRHDRFANGSVKASGFELDGKPHGHWEWFRLDGSLLRSGEFDLGQRVGLWRTWDNAGHVVTETSFDDGRAAPPTTTSAATPAQPPPDAASSPAAAPAG